MCSWSYYLRWWLGTIRQRAISWSSADKRCSDYIWVIKFLAYWGAAYIRGFTVFNNLLQGCFPDTGQPSVYLSAKEVSSKDTEMKTSLWWIFHHWLQRNMKWLLLVQSAKKMKMFSKWQFHFHGYGYNPMEPDLNKTQQSRTYVHNFWYALFQLNLANTVKCHYKNLSWYNIQHCNNSGRKWIRF